MGLDSVNISSKGRTRTKVWKLHAARFQLIKRKDFSSTIKAGETIDSRLKEPQGTGNCVPLEVCGVSGQQWHRGFLVRGQGGLDDSSGPFHI